MKVVVVVSNFYPKISKMLIEGAVSKLKKNKISNFKIIKVPGTFEIPAVVSNLVDKFDAFIYIFTSFYDILAIFLGPTHIQKNRKYKEKLKIIFIYYETLIFFYFHYMQIFISSCN